MIRLSILHKPIKNLIYNTKMPIVIDNIDKYIMTMKDNALTITLKTFDFEISKQGKAENLNLEDKKEYDSEVLGDYAENILQILLKDKKIEIIEIGVGEDGK